MKRSQFDGYSWPLQNRQAHVHISTSQKRSMQNIFEPMQAAAMHACTASACTSAG